GGEHLRPLARERGVAALEPAPLRLDEGRAEAPIHDLYQLPGAHVGHAELRRGRPEVAVAADRLEQVRLAGPQEDLLSAKDADPETHLRRIGPAGPAPHLTAPRDTV